MSLASPKLKELLVLEHQRPWERRLKGLERKKEREGKVSLEVIRVTTRCRNRNMCLYCGVSFCCARKFYIVFLFCQEIQSIAKHN